MSCSETAQNRDINKHWLLAAEKTTALSWANARVLGEFEDFLARKSSYSRYTKKPA